MGSASLPAVQPAECCSGTLPPLPLLCSSGARAVEAPEAAEGTAPPSPSHKEVGQRKRPRLRSGSRGALEMLALLAAAEAPCQREGENTPDTDSASCIASPSLQPAAPGSCELPDWHLSLLPPAARARLAATMARRISLALSALPPDDVRQLHEVKAFLAAF
ncbi:hypothetical protein ABPG75_001700 [Micractinium tetrahymenae]